MATNNAALNVLKSVTKVIEEKGTCLTESDVTYITYHLNLVIENLELKEAISGYTK